MGIRRALFNGWGQAMLAGALFATFVGRMEPGSKRSAVLFLMIAGALYGLGVLGLIRQFRTRSFGLLAAGLLAGPIPAAVLIGPGPSEGDRGGLFVACAFLGLLIGILEWARLSRDGPSGEG